MSALNFLTILGAHAFFDASGKPLARGTLTITAVNGHGNTIPFKIGGGGIAIAEHVTREISLGSLVGTLQLANPAASDIAIGYTFAIRDAVGSYETTIERVVIADNGSGNFNLAQLSAGNYTLADPVQQLWPVFTATATSLSSSASPTATLSGTPENPVLALGIPAGGGSGGSSSPATATTLGTVQLAVGLTSTTLATVATTGSYSDLANKPTITTGTVTTVSGATSGGFTVTTTNPGTTPTVSVTVDGSHYLPTTGDEATWNAKQSAIGFTPLNPASNLSDLASATTAKTNLGLATVASTGAYSDLTGKLTLPVGAVVGTSDTQTLTNKTIDGVSPATMAFVDATSSIQTQLNTKAASSSLATVATSGSASDLAAGTLPAARLPATTVTAGSYTNVNLTVGADGRVTSAASGSGGSGMTYPVGSGIAVVTGGTAWTTTVAAPTGTIVGTTDPQTLTNKTVDGVLLRRWLLLIRRVPFRLN